MNQTTNMPAGASGTAPGSAHDPAQGADDAAQQAKEGTAQVGRDFQQAATDVKDRTTAAAAEVGDRVKQQAKQAADKIKERSCGFLDEQKGRVAVEIQTYSAAARRAAERLEGESDTNLSQYVSTAADRLDQLGSRIQERDLGELVDDVEDIARRRPEIFFGGMFVAGLAVARFLKASKQRRQRDRFGSSSQLAVQRSSATALGANFAPEPPANQFSTPAGDMSATRPVPGGPTGLSVDETDGAPSGGTI